MCLALAGCNLTGSETTVSLELPGAPEHWPESLTVEEYRVVWRGGAGKLREITVAGGASRVEVAIPKRSGVAVLAYPSFVGGSFLPRPAAAIYPHDARGGAGAGVNLAASFERGFTGLVLHRVLFALPSVNSGRLIEEVRARSDGNPWLFDLERVVEKLADGRFSTIYLRPRDVFEVEVAVAVAGEGRAAAGAQIGAGAAVNAGKGSGPGVWIRDNPLARVLAPTDSPDGPMLRLKLPPGHHHLIHAGNGGILSIVVADDGSYRVFHR
ncbi:MAG: hypothetical protein GVY14_06555 [Spirochaetes bacterium]|jgi:hypothetical protein|nr:hypothetical protein [Spirochaetota bacterium]